MEGQTPLVVFVVGTDHHPFDRLIGWADTWRGAAERRGVAIRCVVQHGRSAAPRSAEGRDFIPPSELEALMREAVAVVCHGGPATIAAARRAGVVPIVVARRPDLGEHVDAHQVRFAERLGGSGLVRLVRDEGELIGALEEALLHPDDFRSAPYTSDGAEATAQLDRLVEELVSGPHREEGLKVLYIAGWGRSGSTLLDRMLGQVPGVFSAGELREIWRRGAIEDRLCGCGEPFTSCPFWSEVGARAFGGWGNARELNRLRDRFDRPWAIPRVLSSRLTPSLDREVAGYAGALEALYRAIREVSGARVIVDSSKIATHAMLLRRIPGVDLRLVHLVRDSRGVVFSWQKQVVRMDGVHRDDMLRYGTVSASGRYVLYNVLAHAAGLGRVPYLFLRYEDLVRDPRAWLERVLAHAGEEPGELPFLTDAGAELASNHTVDGNPMRLATGTVAVRADEEWRVAMDPSRRRLVAALTSPLLARYGYSLRDGGS